MGECSCDEGSCCIRHILKYLYDCRWNEYFNGIKNEKVTPGAYPLTDMQQSTIINAFNEYTKMSKYFDILSYQITYRPQHNRSAIQPHESCKCYYCISYNITIIKKIIQLQEDCNFPILL